MASSGHANYLSLKRIIDNVEECKTVGTPEASVEEDVASRNDDAERILSNPVKAGKQRRKKRWGREATQVAVLGVVVIGGIAAIIGLRYLAEMVGDNWIGN